MLSLSIYGISPPIARNSEVAVDAITGQRFELNQGNTDLLLIKLVKHGETYKAYQVPGNTIYHFLAAYFHIVLVLKPLAVLLIFFSPWSTW